MKPQTEKEIIEFIKKWTCASPPSADDVSDWEREDLRKFFRISKKEFEDGN